MHSAINRSSQPRVVLLFDVFRKDQPFWLIGMSWIFLWVAQIWQHVQNMRVVVQVSEDNCSNDSGPRDRSRGSVSKISVGMRTRLRLPDRSEICAACATAPTRWSASVIKETHSTRSPDCHGASSPARRESNVPAEDLGECIAAQTVVVFTTCSSVRGRLKISDIDPQLRMPVTSYEQLAYFFGMKAFDFTPPKNHGHVQKPAGSQRLRRRVLFASAPDQQFLRWLCRSNRISAPGAHHQQHHGTHGGR